MNKKKSVGIQLLGKNLQGELEAILQVRAKWNGEKNAPESYPGACQITVHGKLEEGEDFISGLLREVGEELGEEFIPIIKTLYETKKLIELINFNSPEKYIITYGAIIKEVILQKLLNKEKSKTFGGFKVIRQNEVKKIIDLKTFDKTIGITDENTIAMFPDEKEAVRLAFEKLS